MRASYNGVLGGGSCKLYLSPKLRQSKALEFLVGVLEEVGQHLSQARGRRIDILKSSTEWKKCYRAWEAEKGLKSQPWRMHEVLAENRSDKETLQREHFQHMPEAVHTFHEFLHRRSTVDSSGPSLVFW